MKKYCKTSHSRSTLPFYLRLVRGAIGKEYVIKHYRYAIIKTKYPDMTRIIVSAAQRNCRNLFKEAVAYANKVMANPVEKKIWCERVKQKQRVYNQVIKAYMLEAKKAAIQRQLTGKYIVRACFKNLTTGFYKPEPCIAVTLAVNEYKVNMETAELFDLPAGAGNNFPK